MPVIEQYPVTSYTGNGVTTVFAYQFQIARKQDVLVTVAGVTKILDADYTVSNVGAQAGGNITFLTGAPANGALVRFQRNMKMERTIDYQENGDLLAATLDGDNDSTWLALQQIAAYLGIGPSAVARALLLGADDIDGSGAYDARSNRIKNLDDPTADQDAATRLWAINLVAASLTDGSGNAVLQLLANTTDPDKGAAMVGYNAALSYPSGSIGAALNAGAGAWFTVVTGDGSTDNTAAVVAANAAGKPIAFVGVSVIGTATTITVPVLANLERIFTDASLVTINNGQPVRPEWFGSTQGNIMRAITALPSTGGIVQLEDKTYPPQGHQYGFAGTGVCVAKANVTIQGRKMPRFADDCKSLTGGTIIQGMFAAFADNFELRDAGIDNGYTAVGTYLSGVANPGYAEALVLSYPDDATKAAAAVRKRAKLHNIIALAYGPTASVHAAILGEGYKEVTCTGDIIGMYGVHGTVIKCARVTADNITAYANGSDGLIIKSDAQASAISTQVQIKKLLVDANGPAGLSPYAVATTGAGLLFNAASNNIDMVQIGQAMLFGHPREIDVAIDTNNLVLLDVQIGELITDQSGVSGSVAAVNLTTASLRHIRAFKVGTATLRNCVKGVAASFIQGSGTANHVTFGQLEVINASDVAVDIGSQSYVTIGSMVAHNCTNGVYRLTGTPKLEVGTLSRNNTTLTYATTGSGLVPTLANGWTQVASNDPFSVDLLGGRVCLRGLVKPGSSNILSTLPQWAWPNSVKRFVCQGYNGSGAEVAVPLVVDTSGGVKVNEVGGGFANCTTWLSLSGITYDAQA